MDRFMTFLQRTYAGTVGHPLVLNLSLAWAVAFLTAPIFQHWVGMIPLAILTLNCLRAEHRLAQFMARATKS